MPTSKKRKKKDTKKKSVSTVKGSNHNHQDLEKEMLEKFPDAKVEKYHRSVSEMIIQFAEPLIETSENDKNTRNALEFSIIAWNLSVNKKKDPIKVEEILNAYVDSYNEESRESVRSDLTKLISRKEKMFPDENISIADYKLTYDDKGSMNLSVASLGSR